MIVFYDLNNISFNKEEKIKFYNSSLQKYLKITNSREVNLELTYLEDGKPFVYKDIFVSISHSKNLTLIAFSHCNLGIDTEFLNYKKDYENVANRFFHEDDIKVLNDTSTIETKTENFFKLWCRKEAFIKYVGENLLYQKRAELDEIDYINKKFNNNVCVRYLNIIKDFVIIVYCDVNDDIYLL